MSGVTGVVLCNTHTMCTVDQRTNRSWAKLMTVPRQNHHPQDGRPLLNCPPAISVIGFYMVRLLGISLAWLPGWRREGSRTETAVVRLVSNLAIRARLLHVFFCEPCVSCHYCIVSLARSEARSIRTQPTQNGQDVKYSRCFFFIPHIRILYLLSTSSTTFFSLLQRRERIA